MDAVNYLNGMNPPNNQNPAEINHAPSSNKN
jgi:hypothetical protein